MPYINLTANGNYSDHIGFAGASRFGEYSHFHSKRPSKPKLGQSRGTDVFTVNLGDNNGNGLMHPAAYPVGLCEQLVLQFSREGDAVLDPFLRQWHDAGGRSKMWTALGWIRQQAAIRRACGKATEYKFHGTRQRHQPRPTRATADGLS